MTSTCCEVRNWLGFHSFHSVFHHSNWLFLTDVSIWMRRTELVHQQLPFVHLMPGVLPQWWPQMCRLGGTTEFTKSKSSLFFWHSFWRIIHSFLFQKTFGVHSSAVQMLPQTFAMWNRLHGKLRVWGWDSEAFVFRFAKNLWVLRTGPNREQGLSLDLRMALMLAEALDSLF